jgi:hypothetical protein
MKNVLAVLVMIGSVWGVWLVYRSKNPPGPTGIVGTNMRAVVDFLRTLPQAQQTFRNVGIVDQDGDGLGEFGFLQELGGVGECRGSKLTQRTSPFLFVGSAGVDRNGYGERASFRFVIYLPTKAGNAIAVNPNRSPASAKGAEKTPKGAIAAFPAVSTDADDQEQRWACYAWDSDTVYPTGTTYFINQEGQVWRTKMEKTQYRSTDAPPSPNAAFAVGSPNGANLAGHVGELGTSNDGNTWVLSEGW